MARGYKGPAMAGNPNEVRSAAAFTPRKQGARHSITYGEAAEVDPLADARAEPIQTSNPLVAVMDDVVVAESDPNRAMPLQAPPAGMPDNPPVEVPPSAVSPAPTADPQTSTPTEPAAEPPAATDPDEVDDPRFKGKSKKDIFESLRHAERLIGRQGEELGHMRRFVDTHVRPQQVQPPKPSQEENQALLKEMLENPTAFVQRTQAAALAQVQGVIVQAELARIRNENQAIMQDPAFANWLQTVPPHLIQAADQDPQLSAFIFNQYRTANASAPPPAASPAQPAAPAPSPASPGMPSLAQRSRVMAAAASPGGAARPNVSTPAFTRSQIRKLMAENPAEYERLLPQIVAAHREGRVKDA